ncbi:acyl dehydratase [Bernardetia litoralis DSM 6794]|uniref:Acyl dehydratase n=1 Tax=Bernardetia litoralis (strain ATCC 23117 / DSM 6794 / NBRC 15988 / NCIMB 1366 / Fx l1 / Sio-4) TaxID=880071 RepID=I4AJU5_BERLS|nr:MaoC family dehydratase [Bernardetia litoralis]AFM04230.1 acyl dehydratase [Bernardetia litoralis DSM 6794]
MNTNTPTNTEKLNEKDEYHLTFSYSQEQVNKFAEVTGDNNPLHLDEKYAATTMFKRPIMHGFLGGSIFSKIFGTLFPGEGTIYMNQTMNFMRPMFVDTEYEAITTITEINRDKHRAKVQTQVINKTTGKITIDGEATVINSNRL